MKNRYLLSLGLLAACAAADEAETVVSQDHEIDVIGLSERPASLLVIEPGTRREVERTLDRMGGAVLAQLPPRLVIAQVPAGADIALADAGLVARFDRAVSEADVADATIAEARFLAVYTNRWQADVPRAMTIEAHLAAGAAPEAQPIARGEPGPVVDPEDSVSVPYAAGTVVVSIVLPESNGAIDPSSEDWTEDRVREVYLKVQSALDRIASAEPNAKLRFVVHYESRPAAGGLEGTVDSDYEFGVRAQWTDWANESLATAHVLSKIVGHPVDANDVWTAANEYQLALRRQYDADAAYFFIVAANHNYSAGLRAHAWIGGPWTVLESGNGAEVFAHESGHIFGALDEYCPDACAQPTSLAGYLGVINANADYRDSTEYGSGINGGHGEAATSLMQYNDWTAINGYTRGAWGWLDVDGDGIVDVRDTFPKSDLVTVVDGQNVRLLGTVVDRPATSLWRTPYSVNRITALEVELVQGGVVRDVLDVALAGDTRGRQAVDVTLPPLPEGTWNLRIRARNDVGNVEPLARELPATIVAGANVAPIAHVDLADALSSTVPHPLHVDAVDLDGDAAQVRVDLGADGTFDTGWAATQDLDVTPPAGAWAVVVEARDATGHVSTLRRDALVFDGEAPPAVAIGTVPGLVHGATVAPVALTGASDGAELNWRAKLATSDGMFDLASGWGAPSAFGIDLPTPERLISTKLDLAAGDMNLTRGWISDVLVLDTHTVAVAGGTSGIWFVDLDGPRVLSHLDLQTIARKLWRDGDRLYVLGTMLAVVDIHDLAAPTEIKQLITTNGTRTASVEEVQPLPAMHYAYVQDGERISDAKVTMWIDHPKPGQLEITLYPPKQSGIAPIVLRDHQPGAGGLRKYTFNTHAVDGAFAADGWSVEVIDDVEDDKKGSLVSTDFRFTTKSRAAKVLPEAVQVVGKISGKLIVAGAGVQSLDVALPFLITPVVTITGTGTYDAVKVGNRVVLAMPLESKTQSDPTLRGLCSVDFATWWWPTIVRMETELGAVADTIAKIGNRMYIRFGDYTSIANANAFASGNPSWELARSDVRFDRQAFGDSQTVWTVGTGSVTRVDVSDVNKLRVVASYPQSWAAAILPLDGAGNVLLYQGGAQAEKANLYQTWSTLSRTYQIALEARGAGGATARAYRTVQVIPYDHAPTLVSAEHLDGFVRVLASDPDAGRTWDPNLLVRADWDGDGVFDSGWEMFPNAAGQPYDLWGPVTASTVVEVRDGFWATDRL